MNQMDGSQVGQIRRDLGTPIIIASRDLFHE